MAASERPQGNRLTRLRQAQLKTDSELAKHDARVSGINARIIAAESRPASQLRELGKLVDWHTGLATQYAEEKDRVTIKRDLDTKEDIEKKALAERDRRRVENVFIGVTAELVEYKLIEDKVATLNEPEPDDAPREDLREYYARRAQIVDSLVSDKEYAMLQDLRGPKEKGPSFCDPETVRTKRTPDEIADIMVDDTTNGDINKRITRAKARAGDPESILDYCVGNESKTHVARRLGLFGFDDENWNSILDAQIKAVIAIDFGKEPHQRSPLLPVLYPEYFDKPQPTKTIFQK